MTKTSVPVASKPNANISRIQPAAPLQTTDLKIGREFADVTWRMAVPVVLLAGLGLLADKAWGSKPWLTLLGTMIGFLMAALLVKRQIGELPQDDPNMIAISRAKIDKENENNDDTQ